MSVPKSLRGESDAQFIKTAMDLEDYTLEKVSRFPKRYTFYLSVKIHDSALRVQDLVISANSIYPTDEHGFRMRRDRLIAANAELHALVPKIDQAHRKCGVDFKTMERWMQLIDEEIRLIKGVLKRDRERFGKLLNDADN